jgi:hypothetical protein
VLLDNILIPGIVVPLVATGLALFLLELLQRRWQAPWRGAAGVAVAAGFLAGFVAISGWPRFPPVEATQRLFFLIAAVSLASWIIARARSGWVLFVVELAAVAVMLALVLQTQVEHTWSPRLAIAWLAGLSVIIVVVIRVIGRGLAHSNGLTATIRLAVVCGVAVILGLSESLRLAQLAGALACSIAAVELVAWRGRVRWHRSDAAVVTLTLAGLLLAGYFFAGLGTWTAILSVVALLASAQTASGPRWRQLSPLIPLLVALGLAVAGYLEQDDPYDYYGAALLDAPGATSVTAR